MNIPKIVVLSGLIFSGTMNADVKSEAKACAGIFAGSVAAACLYGIAHDQFTARVCPEYFTEGFHRKMVEKWPDSWLKRTLLTTKSPTKLGVLWGVLASWKMGALCSVPLILASRVGSWPKLGMKDLAAPAALALGVMGLYSLKEGRRGYELAGKNEIDIWFLSAWRPEESDRDHYEDKRNYYKRIAGDTPDEQLDHYIADVYAHRAAYTSGALAALGLTGWILYKRLRP